MKNILDAISCMPEEKLWGIFFLIALCAVVIVWSTETIKDMKKFDRKEK